MLTQSEADLLIRLAKKLLNRTIGFPNPGISIELKLESFDKREEFIVDVNRKGRINLKKCTYQNRYRKDIILLRLDLNGPEHENPNGDVISCPHLHIYKEGFDDKWAYPINSTEFPDTTDLARTVLDFLRYCNVQNIEDISVVQGGIFNEL